jgi:hypothetical protein
MVQTKFRRRTILLLVGCCLFAGLSFACRRETQPPPSTTANTTPSPTPEMYQGTVASTAVIKIKEKIGAQVKVLDINIAPDYVTIDAQDPKSPKKINHYEYRKGAVTGPSPVALTQEINPESDLFSLDEVNLAAVATLVQAAKKSLKIEGGEVKGMDIRRSAPGKEIRWHVGLTGNQKSGAVDADEKGNIKQSRVY